MTHALDARNTGSAHQRGALLVDVAVMDLFANLAAAGVTPEMMMAGATYALARLHVRNAAVKSERAVTATILPALTASIRGALEDERAKLEGPPEGTG